MPTACSGCKTCAAVNAVLVAEQVQSAGDLIADWRIPDDKELDESMSSSAMLITIGTYLLVLTACSFVLYVVYVVSDFVRHRKDFGVSLKTTEAIDAMDATDTINAMNINPAVPSAVDESDYETDSNEYPSDWTAAQIVSHVRAKSRASREALASGGRYAKRYIVDDDSSDVELASNLGLMSSSSRERQPDRVVLD